MAKTAVIIATAIALGTTTLPAFAASPSRQVSNIDPAISLMEKTDSDQLIAGRLRSRGRYNGHRNRFVRRGRFCRRSWSRRQCAFEKFYARKCQYRYRRRDCKRIFSSQFDRYDARFDVHDDRNDIHIDRIAEYILRGIFN